MNNKAGIGQSLSEKSAMGVLVILRLVIGYHLLYEGMDKLFNPQWTSAIFLLQSDWLFAGFFHFLANSPALLSVVNFINIWGQILIGFSLILGLFSSKSAIFGAVMILSYYIAAPPFNGGNIFVDRNLLEFFCLLIIYIFPTGNVLGLDMLIEKYRMQKNGR